MKSQTVEKLDFKSRIVLSVKVMRERDDEKYPYETAIFDTELSVPTGAPNKDREAAVDAWIKMVEGGVEVCKALNRSKA